MCGAHQRRAIRRGKWRILLVTQRRRDRSSWFLRLPASDQRPLQIMWEATARNTSGEERPFPLTGVRTQHLLRETATARLQASGVARGFGHGTTEPADLTDRVKRVTSTYAPVGEHEGGFVPKRSRSRPATHCWPQLGSPEYSEWAAHAAPGAATDTLSSVSRNESHGVFQPRWL